MDGGRSSGRLGLEGESQTESGVRGRQGNNKLPGCRGKETRVLVDARVSTGEGKATGIRL